MTATNRELLKRDQAGRAATLGTTDPIAAVAEQHEETFVFRVLPATALAEQGITMVKKCKVKSIRAMPGAALATHASNYVTGTVAKRDGAGGGATTIGSYTTNSSGGAALAAFVATVVAVTAANAEIAAGGVLTFAQVDNGTTTEVDVGVSVTVEYT